MGDVVKGEEKIAKAKGDKSKSAAKKKTGEAAETMYDRHNAYVLALEDSRVVSSQHHESLLPCTLDSVYGASKHLDEEFKGLADAALDAMDPGTSEEGRAALEALRQAIATFEPNDVAAELVAEHADAPRDAETEEFALPPQAESLTSLLPSKMEAIKAARVVVTESSRDKLEADMAAAKEAEEELDRSVTAKSRFREDELEHSATLDKPGEDLTETMTDHLRLHALEMAVRAEELARDRQRIAASVLDDGISVAPPRPPPGTPGDSGEGYIMTELPLPPSDRGGTMGGRGRPPPPLPDDDGLDGDDGLGDDLESQPWYHGKKERKDIEPLLVQTGDFLVRESTSQHGEWVLSVKTAQGTIKHFKIQREPGSGNFRFEKESFSKVAQLVDYYLTRGLPVTSKSGVVIKRGTPVDRPEDDFGGFGDSGLQDFALKHADVEVGKRLGKGNFGDVCLGTMRATGRKVAVKTCRDTVVNTDRFLEEAQTLAEYNHPNIVCLIGVVCTDPIYIVLELCGGGELLVFLREQGEDLQVSDLVRMSLEGAHGMRYLHQKGCIHRDLAARNCLISDEKVLKISDFGMSRMVEEEEDVYTVSTTAKQIPIKWTAPECLQTLEYSLKSDIWSFGIMLWEMFAKGRMPYASMTNAATKSAVINEGYRMERPARAPDEMYALMLRCWDANPEGRPAFTDIVADLERIRHDYPDESGI